MTQPLAPAVQGALWMTGSMICFSAMNVSVRFLSDTMSPFEQVFLRSVLSSVVLLPFLWRRGGMSSLKTNRWWLHFFRAVLTYLGVASWFYALVHMPLAKAVSLHFTLPLFGMIMAVFILRERLTLPRAVATVAGLCGVLVILRPGMIELNLLAFVVLFSALTYAGTDIAVKILVPTDSPP